MLKVVNVENNPIIGNVEDRVGEIVIFKPRLLMQTPDKRIALMPFLGDPSEMTVSKRRITWWYECRDEGIKKSYVESTTGLSVVGSLVAAGLKN